jgi:hypothetical protein
MHTYYSKVKSSNVLDNKLPRSRAEDVLPENNFIF